jgi:hypothetical protein
MINKNNESNLAAKAQQAGGHLSVVSPYSLYMLLGEQLPAPA